MCNWLSTNIVFNLPQTGVQVEEVRKLDELIAKSNMLVMDLKKQDFMSYPDLTFVVRDYDRARPLGLNNQYLDERLVRMDAIKKFPSLMDTYPKKECYLLPPPRRAFSQTNEVRHLGDKLEKHVMKFAQDLIFNTKAKQCEGVVITGKQFCAMFEWLAVAVGGMKKLPNPTEAVAIQVEKDMVERAKLVYALNLILMFTIKEKSKQMVIAKLSAINGFEAENTSEDWTVWSVALKQEIATKIGQQSRVHKVCGQSDHLVGVLSDVLTTMTTQIEAVLADCVKQVDQLKSIEKMRLSLELKEQQEKLAAINLFEPQLRAKEAEAEKLNFKQQLLDHELNCLKTREKLREEVKRWELMRDNQFEVVDGLRVRYKRNEEMVPHAFWTLGLANVIHNARQRGIGGKIVSEATELKGIVKNHKVNQSNYDHFVKSNQKKTAELKESIAKASAKLDVYDRIMAEHVQKAELLRLTIAQESKALQEASAKKKFNPDMVDGIMKDINRADLPALLGCLFYLSKSSSDNLSNYVDFVVKKLCNTA